MQRGGRVLSSYLLKTSRIACVFGSLETIQYVVASCVSNGMLKRSSGNHRLARTSWTWRSDVSVECSDFMEIQRAVDRRDYEHKDDECGIWFHLNFELCERTQRSRFPGGKWLRCIKMLQSA